jgi:hypothetical protein
MKFSGEDELGHEVARAKWVHARPEVAQHRSCKDALLRVPQFQILHPIGHTDLGVTEGVPKTFENDARKSLFWTSRERWWHRWQGWPDHELLRAIICDGCVPVLFNENGTEAPRSHIGALRAASRRGHNVPEDYLKVKPVGYGEREAWAAAVTILDGAGFFWEMGTNQRWRRDVLNLSSQFLVPDPLEPTRPPYVLDQLWVLRASSDSVRLVALEIDEGVHTTAPTRTKDLRRDTMLTALGYEVFRVAAWWCEVDPYRAIAKFLAAACLTPDGERNFIGSELSTIADYRCGKCGEPMIRWDDDWIQRIQTGDGEFSVVHKQCLPTSNL